MNRIATIIAILIAAGALALAASAPGGPSRVVAVADIHGDYDALIGILARAELIDANQRWTGRDATLVQTGDILDRGPKTRAAMDLLMQLQKDAPRQNGRVVVLMGNHEAMNIYGDLRYVTAADYASYAGNKSENVRKAAYAAYAALPDATPRLSEDEWMKAHPLGFIEYREAFAPDGKYGKWLRSLPAVAKVNDSVFLHGGLKPDFASWKIEQINEAVAREIQAFDAYRKFMVAEKIVLPFYTLKEMTDAAKAVLNDSKEKDPDRKKFLEAFLGYGSWMTINTDGPLWYRGYAEWSEEEGTSQIALLTRGLGAARLVAGHTPQPGEIRSRFNGQVLLIDTGMLAGYVAGGRPSALVIQDKNLTAVYPNESKPLK